MYVVYLMFAAGYPEAITIDVVDRVELSHVFNTEGEFCFDQVIWWDWDCQEDRYQVVDWRLLRDVRKHDELEARRWKADHPRGPGYVAEWIGGHATPRLIGKLWVCEWYDEKSRKNRRVCSQSCIETACSYDRELKEREVLAEGVRRKLK